MHEQVNEVVELTDARAIRAIAHPARLLVIDRLYDEGQSLTATQAAEFAGTTPSAMSYHLRALERFGIVRRADATGDGRERPWVRSARALHIRPEAPVSSRGVASATGAVLAIAMDATKQRLLASVDRSTSNRATALPLDEATSVTHTTLHVNPEEAKELLRTLLELIKPFSAQERTQPPKDAGRLSLLIASAPDTTGSAEPIPTTNRS